MKQRTNTWNVIFEADLDTIIISISGETLVYQDEQTIIIDDVEIGFPFCKIVKCELAID